MKIWPDCTLKTLKNCRPGSIVRPVGYGANGTFAIACDIKDTENCALIYLVKEGPEFQVVAHPEQVKLLEYDGDALLQVDQTRSFEGSPQKMYEANGCLLRSRNEWRMNVRSSQGFSHHRAQYDFTSKMLEGVSNDLSIGTFGKWQLVLVNPVRPYDPPIEVGAFEWKARGGEGE